MPLSVEKEKDPLTIRVIQFFERFRMAYLSALSDPKNYGKKWASSIKALREHWDNINEYSKLLKETISEKELFSDDAENIESDTARRIYEEVKALRYSSEKIKDPFTNKYGENVLEKLLENEALLAKFIHWAIRRHDNALSTKAWKANGLKPDTLTAGYSGLNLAESDIVDFIVEHYGDNKDTKRIKSKYLAAKKLLEEIYIAQHSSTAWENITSLEKAEKSTMNFLVPNKPMYRIFDIDDLKEIKGFTGDYVVQEKYDGMRIQIHKIDNTIKIYSFNEKDITKDCPKQVEVMKKKHFGDCILDAELMLFDEEAPLHRAEVVARIFKDKKSNAILRAHVFDIMRHEGKELHDAPLSERLQILFNNYSTHSDEMLAFPSKKDTRYADSISQVEDYAKEIMELPTSEGVVIKDLTSTYFIGTKKNPKWVKWKKFVDLDLMVLDKKTTKSNMFTYTLGAGPTEDDYKNTKTIKEKTYLNVGKALNTKTEVEIGDIIRVKVDEVKKNKDGSYTLYSAKVIEIPEVDTPDKLITLEMLSKDTKKSLNYNVKALEKGYSISDAIHGDATAIIKGELDGFTFYGFEENNLMAKNALMDLDVWKTQIEDMLKDEKAYLRVSIRNFLIEEGKETPFSAIESYAQEHRPKEFNNVFDNNGKKMMSWLRHQQDIDYLGSGKFIANSDVLEKTYKTPDKYRKGDFKVYRNENENLTILFKLSDVTIGWEIKIDSEEDVFSLFGKSAKFPAVVQTNFRKGKLIDSGEVELGVQRHGYHEYLLDGNKFNTKFHVRVIPVKGEKVWLAWTGLETKRVESDSDDGIWEITNDKFAELTPEELK